MPIRIRAELPAVEVLESENIFVMTHERAAGQDIRPLRIAILNLMPTKLEKAVEKKEAIKVSRVTFSEANRNNQ